MNTVFASLPFYDSVEKQDYNRTKAIIPIHCPRTQLPPFLIALGSESVATVTSVVLVDKDGAETDITGYFSALPEIYTPTDPSLDPYIKYNGDALTALLPIGIYYVKIANGEIEYYSDYIRIDDIYGNIITSLIENGVTYSTFTTSNKSILSAISGGGGGAAHSNYFSVKKDEVLTFISTITVNAGDGPVAYLRDPGTGGVRSNLGNTAAGFNTISLTATEAGSFVLCISNGAAANWSASKIYLLRSYSANFIKFSFRNTDNFGDLLYEDSFTQTVWLEAVLNNPSHEMINIGEEKDGIFIAEKVTSKFIYSIIAYVSRGLYNCLARLPQHDTITITDEVGNTYSPGVGNINIEAVEWVSYETAKITIKFNNDSSSIFNWVK